MNKKDPMIKITKRAQRMWPILHDLTPSEALTACMIVVSEVIKQMPRDTWETVSASIPKVLNNLFVVADNAAARRLGDLFVVPDKESAKKPKD